MERSTTIVSLDICQPVDTRDELFCALSTGTGFSSMERTTTMEQGRSPSAQSSQRNRISMILVFLTRFVGETTLAILL